MDINNNKTFVFVFFYITFHYCNPPFDAATIWYLSCHFGLKPPPPDLADTCPDSWRSWHLPPWQMCCTIICFSLWKRAQGRPCFEILIVALIAVVVVEHHEPRHREEEAMILCDTKHTWRFKCVVFFTLNTGFGFSSCKDSVQSRFKHLDLGQVCFIFTHEQSVKEFDAFDTNLRVFFFHCFFFSLLNIFFFLFQKQDFFVAWPRLLAQRRRFLCQEHIGTKWVWVLAESLMNHYHILWPALHFIYSGFERRDAAPL